MNTRASAGLKTYDYFTAFWQARHAADAKTPEDHVFQLESALEALCSNARPKQITPQERDRLHASLHDARLVSARMFAGRYAPEQIDLGYRAAHSTANMWALPLDQRHTIDPHDTSRPILVCFRADIGNMRRMNELARRAPGVALDELLPPMPRMPSSEKGAKILSFPEF